jgi:hypothetical protein
MEAINDRDGHGQPRPVMRGFGEALCIVVSRLMVPESSAAVWPPVEKVRGMKALAGRYTPRSGH